MLNKMAIDYNAINFKNKDVDKFSTRFGNGDPVSKKKQLREMRTDQYVNLPDGTKASHLMSSKGKEVFPTVFPNKKGSHDYKDWTDMPDTDQAYAEAKKRGEVVKFATEKRAEKMAHGAWKKGEARKEAMQNYKEYKKNKKNG